MKALADLPVDLGPDTEEPPTLVLTVWETWPELEALLDEGTFFVQDPGVLDPPT